MILLPTYYYWFALTASFRTETLFPAPASSLDYLELETKTLLWALTYDSIITYSIVRIASLIYVYGDGAYNAELD